MAFIAAACTLAGCCCLFLIQAFALPSKSLDRGFVWDAQALSHKSARLLRRFLYEGLWPFNKLSTLILRNKWLDGSIEDLLVFVRPFCPFAKKEALVSLGMAVGLLYVGLLVVITKSLLSCLLGIILVLIAVYYLRQKEQRRRKERIALQIPELLNSLRASFFAGFSYSQAFAYAAHELSGPLSEYLIQVERKFTLGLGYKEALSELDPIQDENLRYLLLALDLQRQMGSSAAKVFESVEESLSMRLDLRRSLHVQTAQARFSAELVCTLPLVFLGLIALISPSFLESYTSSAFGWCLLGASVFLQLLGMLLIRKQFMAGERSCGF